MVNIIVIYFILQKNITNKHCIVFSSDQYKRLYWNLFDGNHASVLNGLLNTPWDNVFEYPAEWRKTWPALYPCIYN